MKYFFFLLAIIGVTTFFIIQMRPPEGVSPNGFAGYAPEIGDGASAGHIVVHSVKATLPDGTNVESELRTYYYENGSFIKEMPLGATIYNSDSGEYFFFESSTQTWKRISDVTRREFPLKLMDKVDCQVGGKTVSCTAWQQDHPLPPGGGRFERRFVSFDYSEIMDANASGKVKRAVKFLFGENAGQLTGVAHSGDVHNGFGEMVMSVSLDRVEKFRGRASVSSLASKWVGANTPTCRFMPYYHCE